MIKNWFKNLWPDSYIVFSQVPEGMNVTEYINSSGSVETVEEESFVLEDDRISTEMVEYVRDFLSAYPKTQLIYLTSAQSCSAVGTCSKAEMAQMDVDTSIIKTICKGEFSSYISTMDLENDNMLFKPLELDYIYSPFFLVDEVKSDYPGTALICLHRQNQLIISIYKEGKFIYGDHVVISALEEFEEDQEAGEEIEDDLDADFDLDELDDSDLDDLDDLDDIEEMEDEGMEDDLEEQIEEDDMEQDAELKEYDLKIYSAIKESIEKFYGDESVQSDFVEYMEILDTVALSRNIYELIKDEIFCEVDSRNIDLHREVLELMLKDT